MHQPPAPAPAPDATVVHTGRRTARTGGLAAVVLIVMGVGGLFAALARSGEGGSAVGAYAAGITWLLIFGGFGALTLRNVRKGRNARVSVDHSGLWVSDGTAQNVIPWHSLAGVGVYKSPLGRGGWMHSLELCPHGPIDRDDPVLWRLVRDEEPLDPTLPRLRYRLPLPFGTHQEVAPAAHRYAPQLWFGESERKPGHVGRPDVKGHRERTRGRTD